GLFQGDLGPLGTGGTAQGTEDWNVQVHPQNGGTEPLLSRVQEIEVIAEGVPPVIDKGIEGGQGMALGEFQLQLPLLVEVFGQFEINVVLHGKGGLQTPRVDLTLGQGIQVIGQHRGGVGG